MTEDDIAKAAQRGRNANAILAKEQAVITGSCREIRDIGGMAAVDLILSKARLAVDDHLDGGGA